jgi:hypothetical protein
MDNILPEDDWGWDSGSEYYFLHPNKVVRIVYDEDVEEYTVSEAMGPDGAWFDCNVDQVLTDGRPLTEKEAMDMVDGFGGDW